jgi:hypothetical protein
MMKSQKRKKSLKRGNKNQASLNEPCKPGLNSHICNSLNSRLELNPKAQHLNN